MKTRDSYSTFINGINNRIKYYSDELHFSIAMCSTFYTFICNSNNKTVANYFKEIGFLNQCKHVNSFNNDNLSIELQSTIKIYRSYVMSRIPYFNEMLDNYIFMSSIDYDTYYYMISLYNSELSKLLLIGDEVILSKLGKLSILCEAKKTTKKILDFKKTKENKKYFEDNNIKGDYRIFNTNDEYLVYVLCKNPSQKGLIYYHFEPTNYNNMQDRKIENYYLLTKTDEEILNNTKIGNVQKMNALVKNNLKYKLKYIENAN